MKKILLSTVHHPDVSLKNLEYVCEQLQIIFDEVYLTISNVTSSEIKSSLSEKSFFSLSYNFPKWCSRC